MRNWFLALATTVSAILGNIIASWIDQQYGLSNEGRIGLTSGLFCISILFPLLISKGAHIPGSFAFHRAVYLYDLGHAEVLARWTTRFTLLQLGRGPRYLRSAEVLQQGERRDLVDFLVSSLRSHGLSGRRILVLGEPGCGKTTAMERLTLELARASIRRFGFSGPIPVLLRPSDYHIGQTPQDMLRTGLGNWVKGSTRRVLISDDAIQRLLESSQLVLLCDAVDEISGENRAAFLARLASFGQAGGLAHISVIATCRTRQDPEYALSDYETYSILDLSDDAIVEFVRIYSADNHLEPETIYERLRAGGFLEPAALGRNPFWLVRLIEVGTEMTSRSGILRTAAQQALSKELAKAAHSERRWSRPSTLPPDQCVSECLHALAQMALDMDLRRNLSRKAADQSVHVWLATRPWPSADALLSERQILEMSRDAGLLRPASDPIEFSHRLVQEYFTAQGLFDHPDILDARLSDYIREEGRWEVLAIHAGMLSDGGSQLVRNILSVDRSPKGLACALATRLGDAQSAEGSVDSDLLIPLRDNLAAENSLDSRLRQSLIAFLRVGFDAAAAFLGQLLADTVPAVRIHTCELLGHAEAPEALRLLVYIALDDPDECVGNAAIDALATMERQRIIWSIIRRLYSSSERVRERGARVLSRIGCSEAVNYLLECDLSAEVAGEALAQCAVGKLGRLLIALACDDHACTAPRSSRYRWQRGPAGGRCPRARVSG